MAGKGPVGDGASIGIADGCNTGQSGQRTQLGQTDMIHSRLRIYPSYSHPLPHRLHPLLDSLRHVAGRLSLSERTSGSVNPYRCLSAMPGYCVTASSGESLYREADCAKDAWTHGERSTGARQPVRCVKDRRIAQFGLDGAPVLWIIDSCHLPHVPKATGWHGRRSSTHRPSHP